MLVLLRWVSVARFRSFNQIGMLTLLLAMVALSLGLPTGGVIDPELARGVSRWLPSTWFARLAWAPGWDVLPERLAALALTLGTALIAWWGGFEDAQSALVEDALVTPQRGVDTSLGGRALEAVRRRPLLRRLVDAEVASLGSLILAVSSREEVSRIKLFAPRVMTLLTLAAGFWLEDGMLPLVVIGVLSYTAVFEGLEVMRQSGDAPASWVLWKIPVERRKLLRGLWLALGLRYLALPVLVAGVLLVREVPLAPALALLAALVAGLRLAFVLGLWVRPGLPLAADQQTTQSLFGFGLATVVSVAWTLMAFVIGALALKSAALASLVALLTTGATMAARWSLELLAQSRLDRLEFVR
jgi:hypothetical protein